MLAISSFSRTSRIVQLEVVLRLAVYGPRAFYRLGLLPLFDLILAAAATAASVAEIVTPEAIPVSTAIDILLCIRLLRLFRIVPGFGITVTALSDVVSVLGRYFVLLILSFWVFAVIGTYYGAP